MNIFKSSLNCSDLKLMSQKIKILKTKIEYKIKFFVVRSTINKYKTITIINYKKWTNNE